MLVDKIFMGAAVVTPPSCTAFLVLFSPSRLFRGEVWKNLTIFKDPFHALKDNDSGIIIDLGSFSNRERARYCTVVLLLGVVVASFGF